MRLWIVLLLLLVACRTSRTGPAVPAEEVKSQRPESALTRPTQPPEPPLISLVEPFNYASLSIAADTLKVRLLLIDPTGKSLGFDPKTQKTIERVVGGDLGQDSITDPANGKTLESRWLEVVQAQAGLYTLMVSASKATLYTLTIGGESKGGTHQTLDATSLTPIQVGEVHIYQFRYSQGVLSDTRPVRLK